MNKKGGLLNISFILLIILAILVWGLVGSEKTKEIDIECDIGWKSSLCWKWENSTEQMKDTAEQITGYVVKKAPEVKDKIQVILE